MIKILSKDQLMEKLAGRAGVTSDRIVPAVLNIINEVKAKGDEALFKFSRELDGVKLDEISIKVTPEEVNEAMNIVEPQFIEAIKDAGNNIMEFHKNQIEGDWKKEGLQGVFMGQIIRPLNRVGLYIPGGRAAYPSTVLMNGIPAKVAGVKEVVITTPPDANGKVNPYVLAAANYLGINEIFKVGGAQAVAALAYGTNLIKKVDKIVGPGNIYVSTAKSMVFGDVAIDMIAGPSEILIISDGGGNPEYIAADLISQAEHDPMASSILLTTSMQLAEKVIHEIQSQLKTLPKVEIAKESLSNFGGIVIVDSIEEGIAISNEVAPEHLELMVDSAQYYLSQITNAGSIFLGHYTPESLGDYYAGPNHVLPTSGAARFSSPLGVYDFIKRSSYLHYTKEALEECGDKIIILAEAEGLKGHGNAVKVRLDRWKDL